MIQVDRRFEEICEIRINGEPLKSDDGEAYFLPKSLIGDLFVNELPDDISFEVCDRIEEGIIILETIPISVRRIADNRVRVAFEDSGTRKYWDGAVGFKPYMEAKRAIVEERASEIGDLMLDSYEDDGAWIHLAYSVEIDAEKLDIAVQLAQQIVQEVEGAAEMRIGAEFRVLY